MASQASLDLKIHQPNNFQFNAIPDSHDWSGIADHPTVDSTGPDSVPVIDLDDPKLLNKIRKASEEWGVFLIRNHGIEPELLNRVNEQSQRLFALPVEAKLKVAKSQGNDSGYGGVPISHFFPKFMWFEGFAITTDSPLDHAQKLWPDDYTSFCEVIEEYKKAVKVAKSQRLFALPVEAKRKVAKSQGNDSGYGGVPISHFFPKFMWFEGFAITTDSPLDHAQKLWPDDYTSFCEIIEEYKNAVSPLGFRLLHLMLLSLGLNEEEVKSTVLGDASKIKTSMHLNSYPTCPDPDRVVGLVHHTDTGYIAIINHNGVSGLQVLRHEDDIGPKRWVTVPVIPDTLAVNIGDFMHVLTNGRFHNVMHQSTVNKARQRLSAAYFFGARSNLKVGPLSKLMGPEKIPVYRPVTILEYWKIKDTLHNEALQSLKTDGEVIEGCNDEVSVRAKEDTEI